MLCHDRYKLPAIVYRCPNGIRSHYGIFVWVTSILMAGLNDSEVSCIAESYYYIYSCIDDRLCKFSVPCC